MSSKYDYDDLQKRKEELKKELQKINKILRNKKINEFQRKE